MHDRIVRGLPMCEAGPEATVVSWAESETRDSMKLVLLDAVPDSQLESWRRVIIITRIAVSYFP